MVLGARATRQVLHAWCVTSSSPMSLLLLQMTAMVRGGCCWCSWLACLPTWYFP